MTESPERRRETVGTTSINGAPEEMIHMPGPTLWPVLVAVGLAVCFSGLLIHPLIAVLGLLLTLTAAIGWAWPSEELES